MRTLLAALLLSTAFSGATAQAPNDEANRLFELGVSLASERDTAGAIAAFESALQQGDVSAEAAYNVGTLALQIGDVGKARLYLERAAPLAPGNPSIQKNLRIAAEAAALPANSGPGLARSITRRVPPVVLVLLASVLAILSLVVTMRRSLGARQSRALIAVALIVGLVAGGVTWATMRPSGVVLSSTQVFTGPGASTALVSTIRAGELVSLRRSSGNWVQVGGPHVHGWIPQSAVSRL